MNIADQCTCGQRIPLQRWCSRLGSWTHLGSLWTAAEAAAIYGCAAHRMGVAMNSLFPGRRHIRLGPDDDLGRPVWLYCVQPAQHGGWFSAEEAQRLREIWRAQHAVKDQLARAAVALESVSTSKR
jgi:hypothetical protein